MRVTRPHGAALFTFSSSCSLQAWKRKQRLLAAAFDDEVRAAHDSSHSISIVVENVNESHWHASEGLAFLKPILQFHVSY